MSKKSNAPSPVKHRDEILQVEVAALEALDQRLRVIALAAAGLAQHRECDGEARIFCGFLEQSIHDVAEQVFALANPDLTTAKQAH